MCGASKEQKETYQTQKDITSNALSQAKQIFGDSASVFSDISDALSPIVHGGPDQYGFSAAEDSALRSQAVTQSGVAARNAISSVNASISAVGGGNIALPSGAAIGAQTAVANSAAMNSANQQLEITKAGYATGRQNFFEAEKGLSEAPGVFNPSTGATNAASGAAEGQARTANEIAASNNSWEQAVSGALGGVVGGIASGGMKNLGAGVGFFGQNAPAPA
jgi:hypothetical protein